MATKDSTSTPLSQPPHRLRVTSKVDFVDFAVQVFNLGKEIVNEIRDKHIWALEEADIQSYEKSPDSKGFLSLANSFLTKVHRTLARGRALKPTSRANVDAQAIDAVKCGRSKRLRKEDTGDAGDEESQSKKRAKTSAFKDARAQPSDEAVGLPSVPQCLACISHYFIVKVKVQVFQVTVVYYDQFLELVVAEFDFRERPQDLALVLYGTNSIEAGRAGAEAHLRKWSPYMPASGEGSSEMFFYGTHKCAASCGIGGFLQFPSTNKPAEAGLGRLNNNWVGSHFEMKDSTGKRLSFEITDVIQKPDQFVGDATVAYRMKLARKNHLWEDTLMGSEASEAHFFVTENRPSKVLQMQVLDAKSSNAHLQAVEPYSDTLLVLVGIGHSFLPVFGFYSPFGNGIWHHSANRHLLGTHRSPELECHHCIVEYVG